MSFFNRMMASIGIGSTKVDTQLAAQQFQAGEEVQGVVKIQGGNVEQRIETIYIYLMTQYIKEHDDQKITQNVVLEKVKVSDPFTIQSNQKMELPFTFLLPLETPISLGGTKVWLKTELSIDLAVDPTDNDYIDVMPSHPMRAVLQAIDGLGFKLRKASNQYQSRLHRKYPFVQEFEFAPSAQYASRLDELECIFFHHPQGIEVVFEIDRKARGVFGFLEEALDIDERKQRLSFSHQDIAQGSAYIGQRIIQMLEQHSR